MENNADMDLNIHPSDETLLTAYIGKPEKVAYYLSAYEKMNQAGVFSYKWHWSWWAFFFGWAFMLYRKAYLASFITFLISIPVSMIPFGFLLVMIVTGGISVYFVLKPFHEAKMQLQGSKEEQILAMQNLGGYNTWIIWVIGLFYGMVVAGLVIGVSMNGGHHGGTSLSEETFKLQMDNSE